MKMDDGDRIRFKRLTEEQQRYWGDVLHASVRTDSVTRLEFKRAVDNWFRSVDRFLETYLSIPGLSWFRQTPEIEVENFRRARFSRKNPDDYTGNARVGNAMQAVRDAYLAVVWDNKASLNCPTNVEKFFAAIEVVRKAKVETGVEKLQRTPEIEFHEFQRKFGKSA